MEELLLRALFASKKLDVVDQQCVNGSVIALEIVDRIQLQCLDHIGDEPLGMQVDHPGFRVALQQRIPHRVHQVCFAQTDAAVKK